jgi:hypothetical protein
MAMRIMVQINPPLARAVHAFVIEQSGSGRTG